MSKISALTANFLTTTDEKKLKKEKISQTNWKMRLCIIIEIIIQSLIFQSIPPIFNAFNLKHYITHFFKQNQEEF
jgi:hypothetical protein